MRSRLATVLMVSILAVGGVGATCTPPQQAVVKTVEKDASNVLNDADVACVLLRKFLGTVPAIAEACGIEEALSPAIESILSSAEKIGASDQRTAASRRADAGAK